MPEPMAPAPTTPMVDVPVCMGRSSYFSCMDIQEELQASADYLRERGVGEVDVAIVLGTGLGGLVSEIDEVLAFNYSQIPHIPVATVEFHFGKLIYGELGGKRVLAWQGRFHFYEGYTMEQVVKPVRISKMLGAKALLISNAAGSLNPDIRKGRSCASKTTSTCFRIRPCAAATSTPWAVGIPICASRMTSN